MGCKVLNSSWMDEMEEDFKDFMLCKGTDQVERKILSE